MGSTEEGKYWSLKALHPAEPGVAMSGIPDADTIPTVFQNYLQSVVVSTPKAGEAWAFDAYFFPHPIFQGLLHTHSATAEMWTPIVNTQLGATPADAFDSLNALCESYRLGYFGVTAYHDATALTNSGTLAAAQYVAYPLKATTSVAAYEGNPVLLGQAEMWPDAPRTFTQLQSMPSAYMGLAKEGAYMPYKLSAMHREWHRTNQARLYFDQPSSHLVSTMSSLGQTVAATESAVYPYGITSTYSTGSGGLYYTWVHERMDKNVGHMSARNLDAAASFTFYLRMGVEMQVLPGSQLSSMQLTSPGLDRQALDAYDAISRELRDAYPADYNDLGKIMKVISEVALDVLPALFPKFGPAVAVARKVAQMVAPKMARAPEVKMTRAVATPIFKPRQRRAKARSAKTPVIRLPMGRVSRADNVD